MKTPSEPEITEDPLYEKIIGLGEKSIGKSYYPLLRKKISELEKSNLDLEKTAEDLRKKIENQNILNNLLRISLDPLPLENLFHTTLDSVLSLSWVGDKAWATIFFHEKKQGFLLLENVTASLNFHLPPCDKKTNSHHFCYMKEPDENQPYFSVYKDRSLTLSRYCLPIRVENTTIGMICIMLPEDHIYDKTEEELLFAISNTLAGIIQKKKMIEEKMHLENQLRQTQKMEAIGTLAGGIAHDFNNLLTPILGYTEMSLQASTDNGTVNSYLKEVLKAAERAKGLVRQILKLSHQSGYELKPLILKDIINESLKLLRATIPSTIEIKHNLNDDTKTVTADDTQIHQVIMNLCTNAFHAMRSTGGVLSVNLFPVEINRKSEINRQKKALADGSYHVIEIGDTGKGIEKDLLERIFDPYFTTKMQGEGTGLGLSVVSGIVKNYGGAITVNSTPGQGTVFRVYFPCSHTFSGKKQQTEIKSDHTGTENILVIDDEKAIVSLITSMLESLGYTVTGLTNCIDALEVFKNQPENFDLIITDMTMPHMTGIQLAQTVRAVRNDIPIVVCTGFSELIDEQKAKELGLQKLIMKPVIKHDLSKAIREALDNK